MEKRKLDLTKKRFDQGFYDYCTIQPTDSPNVMVKKMVALNQIVFAKIGRQPNPVGETTDSTYRGFLYGVCQCINTPESRTRLLQVCKLYVTDEPDVMVWKRDMTNTLVYKETGVKPPEYIEPSEVGLDGPSMPPPDAGFDYTRMADMIGEKMWDTAQAMLNAQASYNREIARRTLEESGFGEFEEFE